MGLSYEFDKLYQIGIEGIMWGEDDQIIFYVAEPDEKTRQKIDKGLIEIFGRTIDYQLRDSKELHIEAEN
ncbi:hypothetical protein [Bacillus sp. PS06]|uniref:hypothetical protein n=1 Tax=Bacillus sp. PS06 TaxID=2764176 RepID=UPI001785346F|nr:hypothetical protein [Bacillus sp. PS06]MBD8071355.1 hypothetical protein [Bacillus sp. PS06]